MLLPDMASDAQASAIYCSRWVHMPLLLFHEECDGFLPCLRYDRAGAAPPPLPVSFGACKNICSNKNPGTIYIHCHACHPKRERRRGEGGVCELLPWNSISTQLQIVSKAVKPYQRSFKRSENDIKKKRYTNEGMGQDRKETIPTKVRGNIAR